MSFHFFYASARRRWRFQSSLFPPPPRSGQPLYVAGPRELSASAGLPRSASPLRVGKLSKEETRSESKLPFGRLRARRTIRNGLSENAGSRRGESATRPGLSEIASSPTINRRRPRFGHALPCLGSNGASSDRKRVRIRSRSIETRLLHITDFH